MGAQGFASILVSAPVQLLVARRVMMFLVGFSRTLELFANRTPLSDCTSVLPFLLLVFSSCAAALGQHICGGSGVCSLNGICNSGTGLCHCDPDWTGQNCSVLNL